MDQDQEKALVETLTEGRGGAFFYYSHDRCDLFIIPSAVLRPIVKFISFSCVNPRCRRFVIKTITESEFDVGFPRLSDSNTAETQPKLNQNINQPRDSRRFAHPPCRPASV
jgi:hypothetical protein